MKLLLSETSEMQSLTGLFYFGGEAVDLILVIDEFVIFIANHLGLPVSIDDDTLKSSGHDPSPLFCVQHSEELGLGMQICLITFGGIVFRISDQFAAVLNTRIIASKSDLRLKHEVADVTALPDQERVAFCRFVLSRLAEDGAVFNRPELGLPDPAEEILAIEE